MIFLDSGYHLVNQYYWNTTPLKFSKSFVNGHGLNGKLLAYRRISTTDLLTCGKYEISLIKDGRDQ